MAAEPVALALRLRGADHALEPGRDYLLGSGDDCDLRLPPPAAERHTMLVVTVDGVSVRDLGSPDGTWRNGERVDSARLGIGDMLHFGASEATIVPDRGAAALVPLPGMRTAAAVRRLREIGARAAAAVRRRDAATFEELIADELRRAPWLAGSLLLHALLFFLLWLLLADASGGGREPARVGVEIARDAADVGASLAAPEVVIEPVATAPDEPLPEEPAPAETAVDSTRPPTIRIPTTNPRITAAPRPQPGAGGNDTAPADDPVRTVGSGGFRKTVAELRRTGLEIVFVFDSTGSMGETIADTKATVGQMLDVLRALVPDARVGIVTYRDRGAEVYRVREIPLGSDYFATVNFVQRVSAEGGGDREEDVRAGLAAAFGQRWGSNARRVVVLAGDAPPHREDVQATLTAVKTFVRDGRSFVHTLVTSPQNAGPDTREAFESIARAGKGTCAGIDSRDRVLQRVLTLAFGREFDQDVTAVVRAVEEASTRVDTEALDLARRGGPDLARALAHEPVPIKVVQAIVRLPRRATVSQLIDMLQDRGTPAHTVQAVAWALQRVLVLDQPPVDPLDDERPNAMTVKRLRRLCSLLPD
ncbi:MAG: VWA domain-containing protein [Planctomycetes bacterium]|nr:VWA domain-containing protein [Planctomycetota bacterium]